MVSQQDAARQLITQAIKDSRKGRQQIAVELSAILGQPVTSYDLDEFTRAVRPDRGTKRFCPMEWVPALVKVTGSHALERYALCQDCRDSLELGTQAGEYLRRRRQGPGGKGR